MSEDIAPIQDAEVAVPGAPDQTQVGDAVIEAEPSEEDAREANAMRVWREASKLFSGMRYGISDPVDGWFQTRRQFGDTVTSSRKLRYWKKLKTLTDTLSDSELEYVRFLAHQRFEFAAAVFRKNAVASVTLPITAAVVANQLYPGIVQAFLANSPIFLTISFVGLLIVLAVVFGNVFKARELRMALELEAARRRLRRGDVDADTSDRTSEFDFETPVT